MKIKTPNFRTNRSYIGVFSFCILFCFHEFDLSNLQFGNIPRQRRKKKTAR